MAMQTSQTVTCRVYAGVLAVLTGLFGFRVLAQFLQIWSVSTVLPGFEAWHSGTLPYPMLFMAQLLILALCIKITWSMSRESLEPSRKKGGYLLFVGLVYMSAMLIRLGIGRFGVPDHNWFGAVLPTIFHLVLASFLLVYGHFHVTYGCAGTEH